MNNIHKLILAKFFSGLYFAIPIQTIFFFAKGLSFAEVMWLESILLVGIMLFVLNDGAGNLRDPIFADYYNQHISSYNRATVLSIISLLTSIYLFFMSPIIGYLADINLNFSFFMIALIILSGALVFRIPESHNPIIDH